jgi:Ca-activated chloride channel family protein
VTFLWPRLLWLCALLPVLLAVYWRVQSRRRNPAVRYAGLTPVQEATGFMATLRRNLPPALLFLALALMIVAIARPAAVIMVPSRHEAVILAMDVSGSMRATDVKPNRITAAQEAARAFVAEVPRSTRVGVVAFAATASVVQYPTTSRDNVRAAIDRFQLQPGTAIGSGILVALKTIFPDLDVDLLSANLRRGDAQKKPRESDQPAEKPVEPGSHGSAVIVLLSDGQSTTGPDVEAAAKIAAERGVRVYTVGIGTPTGETLSIDGWSMRVRLDEAALKSIATLTRGEYFQAATAADLKQIYEALTTRLMFERRETEISAIVAGVAALLALLSATLSLWWFNRIL